MSSSELLTVDEAAELLRTSKKAIYHLVERGALPAVRFGKRLLFNRAELRHRLGLTTDMLLPYSKGPLITGSERIP